MGFDARVLVPNCVGVVVAAESCVVLCNRKQDERGGPQPVEDDHVIGY